MQDVVPCRAYLGFRIVGWGIPEQVKSFDFSVHACDALVENKGVGDYGARHTASGWQIAVIPQQARNVLRNGRAKLAHIVQNGDGAIDALLQNVCGGVNLAFGHRHQPYQVGNI